MEKKKKLIQSVERALKILECFKKESSLGLTEISDMVGLQKSTAFGIVDTLTTYGWLFRDPVSGKYQLGIEVYKMGQYAEINLCNIARPFMYKLLEEFGETVNLVQHDCRNIIYLDKVESARTMRTSADIGKKAPFFCTAAGKAILAYLPPEKIERALESYDYYQYTKSTARSAKEVRRQLQLIQKYGYSIDNGEYEEGLICVGVPILSPEGYPVAGLSVSGPEIRMTPYKIQTITVSLLSTSKALSECLYRDEDLLK